MDPHTPGMPWGPSSAAAWPGSTVNGGWSSHEGIPTPCSNCGAPMQLVTGPYLHSDAGLSCGYCHRREPLPADATERVRYLQFRLTQVSLARQNDEAPLRTMDTIKRYWIPALGVSFVVVAVQIGQSIAITQSLKKVAPDAVYSYAMPVGVGLAVFLGYLLGYIGMLRGYRVSVRPLLRARPPRAAGLSLRCRSCGGDLPNVNAPEIVCRYCTARNQLDSDLTRRAGELLQAEISAYQARANHVYSSEGFRAPTKAFYRWGGAGAVAGLLLGVAGMLALASFSNAGEPYGNPTHRATPVPPTGRVLR